MRVSAHFEGYFSCRLLCSAWNTPHTHCRDPKHSETNSVTCLDCGKRYSCGIGASSKLVSNQESNIICICSAFNFTEHIPFHTGDDSGTCLCLFGAMTAKVLADLMLERVHTDTVMLDLACKGKISISDVNAEVKNEGSLARS